MKWALGWLVFLSAAFARADVAYTVGKLRTYCAACHALGDLRFINSDDDQAVWEYLFHNKSPQSKRLWSEAILDVLDWPSDAAPPFNQMKKPPSEDWMPKGKKRVYLAADSESGVTARRRIREDLLAELRLLED